MRLSSPRPVLLALSLALLPGRAGADTAGRRLVAALLAPDRIERATLSPDGRHLAYVVREGALTALKVRTIDPPDRVTTIRADMAEQRGFFRRRISARADVPYLGWAPDGTLVYEVVLPDAKRGDHEEIHDVHADGGRDRIIATSADLATWYYPPSGAARRVRRPVRVLGFTANSRSSLLVVASGSLLVPTTSYRIDLRTGRREALGDEDARYRMIFDELGNARVRETPRVLIRKPRPAARIMMLPLQKRQRFEYRLGRTGRWRPLDDLAGGGFSHDDDDYYHPRSVPLGFGADPDVLYVASDVGGNTWGIYGLDLTTGRRTAPAVTVPGVDLAAPEDAMTSALLVEDRAGRVVGVRIPGSQPTTRWLNPDLARLQQEADTRFPHRVVRLVDWTASLSRALLLVSGPTEPGRYFVFETGPRPLVTEVLRVRNEPNADDVAPAESFSFTTLAGTRLSGSVTLPPHPRLNPPPLVVLCPDLPGGAPRLDAYDPEAQVLAQFGYMVVRVAYRGTAGFGRRHREAVQAGFDRVPLEDIRATLHWLEQRHPYNHPRVALVGRGFGGYVALRGVELFPGQFRAAVVIDGGSTPAELATSLPTERLSYASSGIMPERMALRRAYFASARTHDRSDGLHHDLVSVRGAVLFVQDPGPMHDDGRAHALYKDLRRQNDVTEYVRLDPGDEPGDLRANQLLQIVGFLNANLYDYRVDIGRERVVK